MARRKLTRKLATEEQKTANRLAIPQAVSQSAQMNPADFQDPQTPGYYRTGETHLFPFAVSDSSIWYALLVIQDGKIVRLGFTSSKAQKKRLLAALIATQDSAPLLFGVWTGSHKTALFVLEPAVAMVELGKV
jgi:hypothetical protein